MTTQIPSPMVPSCTTSSGQLPTEPPSGTVEPKQEVVFEKYARKGAYHWAEMSIDPRRRNAVTVARYRLCLRLLENALNGGLNHAAVLDMGCGDGVLAYEFVRKGCRVTGVDISPLAVQLAAERHKARRSQATFVTASCYDTGLTTASFDGIVSTDVIEHVQDPDRFCREIYRLLKPGASAVLSTPIRLTERPRDQNHVQEWFEEGFQQLIRRHFPAVTFQRSHPVCWVDRFVRSRRSMVLVNLVSLFRNPFVESLAWRTYTMQYAVCSKA